MIVFVSYSNRNRQRIEDLVLQLGQLGHDVQFESKVIGGDITWQQVLDTIATGDLFVATLSAETLVSYSSRIETEYARDLNKYILFVALDEISTLTSLDPQISANAVDFSNANPSANEALAAAINSLASLEPRPLAVVPPPNWDVALNELGQDIRSKTSDRGEQGEILLNLREFLERHETFEPAKILLAAFSARNDLRPEIRVEARRLTSQVKRIGSLIQKLQRRSLFYGAIILSLLVSLAVVLLSQVVLQFRAQRGATARLTSTAQTPRAVTVTFTPVQTRVVATTTFTQIAAVASPTLVSNSPEFTATEALLVTSDSVSTSMAISPNGTSTAIPATTMPAATFTQTTTPVPPTSITVIPKSTSTPIPFDTNTPRSVTETMVAQVSTVTKPSVTSIPSLVTTSTVKPKPSSTPTPKPATKVPATVTPTTVPTKVASLSPTVVPTVTSTLTPKPSFTPTPKPATKVPATVTPTTVPTQAISLLPTVTPTLNLAQLLPRSVYVGMDVDDTLFGIQVKTVGKTAKAAGVQVGDYILAVDLDIVKTRLDFFRVMEMRNPFSNVTLRMRRDNRTVVVSLVLGVTDFALPNAR